MRDAIERGTLAGGVRAQAHESLGRVLAADIPQPEWCTKEGRKLAAEAMVATLDVKGLSQRGEFSTILRQARDAAILAAPRGDIVTGPGTVDDLLARHKVEVVACPTGVAWLDAQLGGGLHRGRVGAVLAETGGGKSHMLVALGAEALRQGLRVFHVTLEMPAWEVQGRYDRSLSGKTREEISLDPAACYNEVASVEERLSIEDATDRSLTPHSLEASLDRQEHQPDVLIVDYAQLMSSGRVYGGDGGKRQDFEDVVIDLRRLAQRGNYYIWTAYQANRSGAAMNNAQDGTPIDKTHVGQCYAAASHIDVLVSLNQTPTEAMGGMGRLFLSKNRGGADKCMKTLMFDWARSRIGEC